MEKKNIQGALDGKVQELAEHSTKHGELRTLDEMINRDNPRVGTQTQLERNALSLPDLHLPKDQYQKNKKRV